MLKRESRDTEYKSSYKTDSFLKTVCAFANFDGGEIIFGVEDSRNIVGIAEDLDKACLAIENKINDLVDPTPVFHLSPNYAKKTIVLSVESGIFKPYFYKNKSYKRADTSTVELNRLELQRMILEGQNQEYEDLPATIQKLTFQTLGKLLKENNLIKTFDQDILKTLGLFTEKSGYNRAAEILADTNNYPGIDIVQFRSSLDEIQNRRIIEHRSILTQYQEAIHFFASVYTFEEIKGFTRKRVALIPDKAFREAIANALIHRHWDIGASIRIAMFPDKIEITSPGGLPAGLSEKEYLNSQISNLRNTKLAYVFLRLGYIEKLGTGIARIRESYSDSISKPEFTVNENSICVVLPVIRKNIEMLSADEQLIYSLIQENREMSRLELEEESGFKKDKTIRILNKLIDKNLVLTTGAGRGMKYKLA